MKIINLFKYFVIIFLICYTSPLLFSEQDQDNNKKESNYQFSTGASLGMLYGTSFELVYRTGDILLSELTWDMKPLFYFGSFVEFSRKDPMEKTGFYAKLGLKFGFPANTGFMEDRDWEAANYELSNFSRHDNFTNSALLLDFAAGISIPGFSTVIITPFLGFNYMHYKWTGRDGYLQYASGTNAWDDSLPKIPCYGPVISYSQNWIIFSAGFSVRYPFLKRFVIEGGFSFSPLILVYALDDHFLRSTKGLQFHDEVSGGYLLEPTLGFTYRFTPKMQLNLKASYRYTNNTKGNSQGYNNENDSLVSVSLAGAEYQVWDLGLTFSYNF